MPPVKTKNTSKKTTPRKKKSSVGAVALERNELLVPEKQFINVYDKDPVLQTKTKLAWLIVGLIMLAIISVWFWSLKISLGKNSANEPNLPQIASEIDNLIQEFKGVISTTKKTVEETSDKISQAQELEKIKNEVLAQIQVNADSDSWPQHSSKLLGLALQYPTNWHKQEKKDLLILASYDLKSTTTVPVSAKIIFTKLPDNNTTFKDLVEPQIDYSQSAEEIFIDLMRAEKYGFKTGQVNTISYSLFVRYGKNIYKIDVSSNDKNIFAATIDKIISTIDWL